MSPLGLKFPEGSWMFCHGARIVRGAPQHLETKKDEMPEESQEKQGSQGQIRVKNCL